jgi:hypothetical protein
MCNLALCEGGLCFLISQGILKVGTLGTLEQSFKINDLRGTLGGTLRNKAEQRNYGTKATALRQSHQFPKGFGF